MHTTISRWLGMAWINLSRRFAREHAEQLEGGPRCENVVNPGHKTHQERRPTRGDVFGFRPGTGKRAIATSGAGIKGLQNLPRMAVRSVFFSPLPLLRRAPQTGCESV